MKFSLNTLIFLFSVLLVCSCQKELNFDTDGLSTGSLKTDSSFDCLPSTVNGVYKPDSVLGTGNYIDVEINVIATGAYIIESDTVNGYFFKGVGAVGNAGSNLIRLYGNGTPVSPGINTFIIRYDSSFCFVDVEVTGTVSNADYTFGGNGGPCTGTPVLAGTYMESLPANSGNTVTLDIDVNATGSYDITTDTVNGIYFTSTGNFTDTTPPQTVTLTAAGTPLSDGPFTYNVNGNGSSCSFSVTYDTAAPPASITFGGAPGNCTGVSLSGPYQQNSSTASSTATIDVTVNTAGLYTISTNTQNGVTFSATGLFSNTGSQTVMLSASGVPAASGSFNFTVSSASGASTCTFAVPFTAAPTGIYNCKIDGVYTSFADRGEASIDDGTGPYLYLNGYTGPATGGTVPQFQIFITMNDASAVMPGTYNVDGFLLPSGGYRLEIDYTLQNPDLSVTIWNTSSTLIPPANPPFTVVVTSVTATRVQGTFSGTLKNTLAGGTLQKIITEGVFDLPIQ